MSASKLHGAVEWALMIAFVFGAGAIAQAQQEDEEQQGRVVQIGQADEEDSSNLNPRSNVPLERPTDGAIMQQELPTYWIGLRGTVIGDDDPLRAHVDLPADKGLLVAEIVPDSPAAKAGLKKYDILLRANDTELHEMNDLIELVAAEGEKQGQITLEVVRHGERETVYVTPEERPAEAMASPGSGQEPFGQQFGVPQEFERFLQGRGQPFDFRNFGPGVIVGGGHGMANIPNGVSVSILKDEGQPPRITVKRGDQTWEVVGDDPESLAKLPEDLRPFVEQLLRGESPLGMNFQMPNIEVPDFDGLRGGRFSDERLRQRLDQMERQMNELLEQFNKRGRSSDQPEAEQEEAK